MTAEELHRSMLVAQQMLISEVLDSAMWMKRSWGKRGVGALLTCATSWAS